jgi:hypothetical protein
MPNYRKVCHQQGMELIYLIFLQSICYQNKPRGKEIPRSRPDTSCMLMQEQDSLAKSKPHVGNDESTVYYLINIALNAQV